VIESSRLRGEDVLRVAAVGLRTRPTRAVLSALGITIGIASMVAVLGLSESSKSDLIASLDRLGTRAGRHDPVRGAIASSQVALDGAQDRDIVVDGQDHRLGRH